MKRISLGEVYGCSEWQSGTFTNSRDETFDITVATLTDFMANTRVYSLVSVSRSGMDIESDDPIWKVIQSQLNKKAPGATANSTLRTNSQQMKQI